jgi:hypothetical protein
MARMAGMARKVRSMDAMEIGNIKSVGKFPSTRDVSLGKMIPA